MKRLYIYCEGQTEEGFVNKVLSPYLQNIGIFTIPIVCMTKRTASKKYKGGVSTYSKIKQELTALCRQHPNEMITTMFDYYGLPEDAPGVDVVAGNIYEKAQIIETAIKNDIGGGFGNLFFNLVLHEFEGLLFTDTAAFVDIADSDAVANLLEIKNEFETPEHINNSPLTAPSKRIIDVVPHYSKVIDGIKLSKHIGIDGISAQCRHFGQWISKMIALAEEDV